MCTTTNSKRFKFTLRPIICYKVMCYDGYDFLTPYQRMIVKLGKTVKTPFKTHKDCSKWIDDEGKIRRMCVFTKDVIHSFISTEKTKLELSYLRRCTIHSDEKYTIVKCIVPRFTRYLIDRSEQIIISKKLKYLKICVL